MKITRMHGMTTQQEAIEWVDTRIGEMVGEFGNRVSDFSYTWYGNVIKFSFKVARLARFKGTLTVTRDCLHLDLPFPMLARPREGAGRAQIGKWLDENLPT